MRQAETICGVVMGKPGLTVDDVRTGLETLIDKVTTLALCAHILDKYFDGFYVTHKTLPMSIVISEFVKHLSGQLSRLYRDDSRRYKTASISTIYNALKKPEVKKELTGVRHQELFDSVELLLRDVNHNLDKVELRCDKYYAHTEIRSVEQAKQDAEDTKITWYEIRQLIDEAKKIINIMSLYVADTDQEFGEGYYDGYQRRFWELIDPCVFQVDLS